MSNDTVARNRNQKYILPENDAHWDVVKDYIEVVPDDDYQHASEEAFEAFRDLKYTVRIHFGLYSLFNMYDTSWPFLPLSNEARQEYQESYHRFNPENFNADEWMRFFKEVGLEAFAFTTKHHEGFSLYDTKTRVKERVNWLAEGGPAIEDCDLAYSVMETPFKRDIVKELCDAARKHGLKIDLYFSHPDWFDADFRPYVLHPMQVPDAGELVCAWDSEEIHKRVNREIVYGPKLTDEAEERMIRRHRQQLIEILSNYGKIDMLCLDMWFGHKVWPELRETVKLIRKIQPDVMIRARGIGNYGDYYTPECFVPGSKENTEMPWMVIYPLARSFSYDPDAAQHKGAAWIIRNLVDAVSKGGSFMVGIGPDGSGRFHPTAVNDLKEAGDWLKINGEAIYRSRALDGSEYKEGEFLYFTRSKDRQKVYAICLNWPGRKLVIKNIRPLSGSEIYMLGFDSPLEWNWDEQDGLKIVIPDYLQKEANRPCQIAYSFRITVPAEQ